jgi:uncharacterized membrane protein
MGHICGMGTAELPGGAFQFEAVIVPHRSLSPAGLRWVLGILLLLSGVVSAGLWYLGAWPVIGFTGIEAVLAVWLLHRNATGTKATELLLLSDAGLLVVRTDRAGRRRERRLSGEWLRADLEERPGQVPALLLRDRGKRMEVGAALGEAEKRQLATALQDAIHRQRHPVFDNPQLRGT